ncbi:uncharacterized protein RAG0_01247 [Rhynchosporium agropyri]|uniref:Subtilisin-like serine protease n=1 Tax=Rhynchosporium agropyri TaxID=914238 RepID=A0A1E1JWL2_9HELO|nr:uncharacterized protein RAG0_01247 [Rhynchosporium agropyri]
MRLSFLASAFLAGYAVQASSVVEDLRAFLAAHKDRNGVSDTDGDFLDWKSNAFSTNSTTAPVLPKGYIIQLKPGSDLVKRGQDEHSLFHERASLDIQYSTRVEFKNPELFFGLSIQVKDDANETTIQQIPNVLRVWKIRVIPRPIVTGRSGNFGSSLRAVVPNITATAGSKADVNSVHRLTEVDRLHALGIKGRGIKIAIMDSGVDHRHTALGPGFGPGHKISFGKDFVGDNYDSTGIPETDDDPLATCIIGMQDKEGSPFGLVGVAPEAELGMYRVFGCSGGAPSDILMLGFEQAATDKVDVLSVSLGAYLSWADEDPFQFITAALEAKGIAVVSSSGNSASFPGDMISPAIGKGVIAVGSVQSSHFPTLYSGKDSRGRSFKYAGDPWPVQAPATGLTVYNIERVAAGSSSPKGCSYDAMDMAAAAIQNKNNSILAMPRGGGCNWRTKMEVAKRYGFKYTLVYATEADDIFEQEYGVPPPDYPYHAITINEVDGRTLLGGLSLSKPNEYKLFFPSGVFESHVQVTGGLVSNYSSWGPTSDTLQIKPQVVAPGNSILSTWPLEASGYAILSGTSMAAPYVAGALALLKSQFPNASVQQLREKLQSTANTLPYVFDNSLRASVAQQGGGLINVYNAVNFQSSVTPSELNLGDLDQLRPREIIIENKSSQSKTYIISHEPTGEANLLPSLSGVEIPVIGVSGLPGLYASYATVKFSSTSITIRAGQTANITVTFQPPTDLDKEFLPVYSGFIKVTNNNDQFKVAYLGQPYSRYKADYIDTSTNFGEKLPALIAYDEDYNPYNVPELETFDFGNKTVGKGYPYLQWVALQSSIYFGAEIVPYNTSFVPDFYGFTFNESNPYGVPASALPLQYPKFPFSNIGIETETYGLWTDSEQYFRPALFLYYLEGVAYKFEKQSLGQLPDGDYRALLRVQRWGGDQKKSKGYQSWLSPVIRVKRSS